MSWTEQQYSDYMRNLQSAVSTPLKPKARASPQPRTGYRSKTEERYAAHLELLRKAGEILDWRYEAVTLKLANGVRYTPDFVLRVHSGIWFEEVKGRSGATFWARPVGKIKIKLAAELFPFWRFAIVFPAARTGEWESVTVGREQ